MALIVFGALQKNYLERLIAFRSLIQYVKDNSGNMPPDEEAILEYVNNNNNLSLGGLRSYDVFYGLKPTEIEIINERIIYKPTGKRILLVSDSSDPEKEDPRRENLRLAKEMLYAYEDANAIKK